MAGIAENQAASPKPLADEASEAARRKNLGRWIGRGVAGSALVALLLAVWLTDRNPRTDDASVRANFIGIAPEVSGRLVQLPVKDNAFVKKGELLFEIDPRPYRYALSQSLSDQEALEQQIVDAERRIAAEHSAVEAAKAGVHQSTTSIKTAGSSVDVAKATVVRTQAASAAAEAQLKLATNNLNRIEPLLQKQYVTVEQVDQTRTALRVAQGNYDESQAALVQAQAQEKQSELKQLEADALSTEAVARLGQAIHTVDTVDTLKSQRPARLVDVYLMGHPDRKFNGIVESVGYGVFPEDGGVAQGLPNIERTLNWVHLSSRFPVRVRILNPDPELFRIGSTAVTVVR
jgi:multidrug efflux system membrane fusion protein